MPTVLHVLTRLNIGGPSRLAAVLHRALTARGWHAVLAAGASDRTEGDYAEWDDLEVVRIPGLRRGASPVEAARATAAIGRLVRWLRPDIVHTHMAMAGFTGRVATRRPVKVHTFHGHVLEGYFSPRRERLYTTIERRLARRTDALVAVSTAVRDDLLARGIGRPGQWHVVPLGLELHPLLTIQAPPPRTRTVAVVGRLVPIKDHETLFRAVAQLDRFRLVVAGDGELRTHLERRAAELGLAERVEFRGWVRDLPSLYAGADVVVLSSLNEGTPVALIEAMAARRPVVATAVGGVPDVVTHERTGLLVPPRDPTALADAIRRVLDNPALAGELAARGRAEAERYRAEPLVDDIDALYGGLLERSRVRGGPSS